MFESFDESTFQALESIPSATPVSDTPADALHRTARETVSECKEVQGYSIEQIMSICSIARRTAFKYATEVVQTWFWLPEYEFRVNGVYSEFALSELKRRKALGTPENYRSVVHSENEAAIAAYQSKQQPTAQAANTEVVEEPTAGTLARIQQDRYVVPSYGSDRLAKAQERRNNQRSSLTNTRERVRQALLNLATQTAEDKSADELDREARHEEIYEESYAEALEELQIKNAAKRDAVADWEEFKRQAMGKGQTPNN